MDLQKFTSDKTEEFLTINLGTLVFCDQNEYARFGQGTNRRLGGTGGMDSCSGAFLWNANTKEALVFHTHSATNWPKTKELFSQLCQNNGWEITPVSGKSRENFAAAWRGLERISKELEDETKGRIKYNPTIHAAASEPTAFNDSRDYLYGLHSYCMDGDSGKIFSLDEAILNNYWNRQEYAETFGKNPWSYVANGYQFISRAGTVPVCSFDGHKHTGARPVLDDTPESRRALRECEQVFVEQLFKHGRKILEILAQLPEHSDEYISALARLDDVVSRSSANQEILDYIQDKHSRILKPELYIQPELHCRAYAKQVANCLWNSFPELAKSASLICLGISDCLRPETAPASASGLHAALA